MPGIKPEPARNGWFDATGMHRNLADEVSICPDCGCKWMELIQVYQYPKYQQVVLGQRPAPIRDVSYYLFKCPKCSRIYEPSVQVGMQNAARKAYDAFLDDMISTDTSGEDV